MTDPTGAAISNVYDDNRHRYMMYTPVDENELGDGTYVRYGLDKSVRDGNWHTFMRDLQADLEEVQPGVVIQEVNGFLIRGSGRVDDIKLLESTADGDGMEDGREVINGLNPLVNDASIDSDNDGVFNYIEFKLGTDPNNPNSIPQVKVTYDYDDIGQLARAISIADRNE